MQPLKIVQQTPDNTAAWLAFTGALLVALIAAATAQWRQRGQLRHDRELKDLEELRALLDECAQVIAESSQALLKWTTQLQGSRLHFSSGTTDERPLRLLALSGFDRIASTRRRSGRLSNAFTDYHEPIFGLFQRVALRVGEDAPLALAFKEVQAVYGLLLLRVQEIDARPIGSRERTDGLVEFQERARTAHFDFLEEARILVGSRIREQP